jgi:PmbA protein
MEPGEATLPDMLADIKQGLYVDQVMGAWAGNALAGEFSGNVHLGYRIENGEIVGRVKDTMVAGNVFQALGDVAALGRELHWVGGSLRLPYLYLRSLGVASKG